MRRFKLLAALALMLGLIAGAQAQLRLPGTARGILSPDPDIFALPPGLQFAQAAGNPDEENNWQGLPEPEPVPENPVMKVYENGRITVLVGSSRHFGYRIGDILPLSILVLADQDVRLNFDAIERGVLSADGSDFEVVEPAKARLVQQASGRNIYRIDLTLRSFVMKPGIVFDAQLLYALDMIPNSLLPNWKRLTTPDFVVTTSRTADNGTSLLEGDMSRGENRISWFTWPLAVLGGSLFLLWPSLLVLSLLKRVRPGRALSREEAAWQVLDRVFRQGKRSGFSVGHYKKIAAALRRYLEVEAETLEEVIAELRDRHPQIDVVKSALSRCEDVLFREQVLDDEDNEELQRELKQLIPLPVPGQQR